VTRESTCPSWPMTLYPMLFHSIVVNHCRARRHDRCCCAKKDGNDAMMMMMMLPRPGDTKREAGGAGEEEEDRPDPNHRPHCSSWRSSYCGCALQQRLDCCCCCCDCDDPLSSQDDDKWPMDSSIFVVPPLLSIYSHANRTAVSSFEPNTKDTTADLVAPYESCPPISRLSINCGYIRANVSTLSLSCPESRHYDAIDCGCRCAGF
jgi:hypothetical protein